MSNMSYCRFENTLADLEDCYDALINQTEWDIKELSDEEYRSQVRLIKLCGTIYHEFEDNPTCDLGEI